MSRLTRKDVERIIKESRARYVVPDLSGSDMDGIDLRDMDLQAIDLRGASMIGARLSGSNLSGSSMNGANLQSSQMVSCRMDDAYLSGAILVGSNMEGAYLVGAKLLESKVMYAILRGAYLNRATLRDADLTGSDLTGANMTGANMRGADLTESDLTDAMLRGSDLTGANMTGAKLVDTDFTRANTTGIVGMGSSAYAHSTFGRHTGDYIKARKSSGMDPSSFKRKYPSEADRLKSITRGRPIRPDVIAEVQSSVSTRKGDGSPLVWIVTKIVYRGAQRISESANDTALFNVDIRDFSRDRQAIIRRLSDTSRMSSHPQEYGNLFTIGWVRYLNLPHVILIEEVQSDVEAARRGLRDIRALRQMGYSDQDAGAIDRELAFFQPYVDAFYYDAVGTIFEIADVEGKPVEMISHVQKEYVVKRDHGPDAKSPPKSVYEDLPKKMGMVKVQRSAVGDVSGPVWYYKPNRRRRRT